MVTMRKKSLDDNPGPCTFKAQAISYTDASKGRELHSLNSDR